MRTLILLTTAFLSVPAHAHHNYRLRFDYDRMITVSGVVTKFDWKNPHVEFFMDVEDETGNVSKWLMPTGAPGVLTRNGITPDTILPGDTLIRNYLNSGWPSIRDDVHLDFSKEISLAATQPRYFLLQHKIFHALL